jgi:hypothetical protein
MLSVAVIVLQEKWQDSFRYHFDPFIHDRPNKRRPSHELVSHSKHRLQLPIYYPLKQESPGVHGGTSGSHLKPYFTGKG